MDDNDRPVFIDHIFFQLTAKLTNELNVINVDPPTFEVLVIKKALTVMSMWKFVIHNEQQTLQVKIPPRSFARLISSNIDE